MRVANPQAIAYSRRHAQASQAFTIVRSVITLKFIKEHRFEKNKMREKILRLSKVHFSWNMTCCIPKCQSARRKIFQNLQKLQENGKDKDENGPTFKEELIRLKTDLYDYELRIGLQNIGELSRKVLENRKKTENDAKNANRQVRRFGVIVAQID